MNSLEIADFWTIVTVSIVGFVSSIALIVLIYKDGRWHDFNRLICIMTAFEAVYFIGFCNYAIGYVYSPSSALVIALQLIEMVGGLASYIVSGIISVSVTYLLVKRKIFNIAEWRTTLCCLVILPNIIFVAISIVGLISEPQQFSLYLTGYRLSIYFRLAPVILNILCYFFNVITVRRMGFLSSGSQNVPAHAVAIVTLVDRLKWYPLLQVLARICPTWLVLAFPNYAVIRLSLSNLYYVSLCYLSDIFIAMAPVGFLIVYVVLQRINKSSSSSSSSTSTNTETADIVSDAKSVTNNMNFNENFSKASFRKSWVSSEGSFSHTNGSSLHTISLLHDCPQEKSLISTEETSKPILCSTQNDSISDHIVEIPRQTHINNIRTTNVTKSSKPSEVDYREEEIALMDDYTLVELIEDAHHQQQQQQQGELSSSAALSL